MPIPQPWIIPVLHKSAAQVVIYPPGCREGLSAPRAAVNIQKAFAVPALSAETGPCTARFDKIAAEGCRKVRGKSFQRALLNGRDEPLAAGTGLRQPWTRDEMPFAVTEGLDRYLAHVVAVEAAVRDIPLSPGQHSLTLGYGVVDAFNGVRDAPVQTP